MGSPQEFQSRVKAWGRAMLPLLLPGALVLMFGGTRTWHREAAGMEDAGFHLWDTLMWLTSQGFPKAQDISKLVDKHRGDERGPVVGKYRLPNGQEWNLAQAADPGVGHAPGTFTSSGTRDLNITAPGSEVSAPWAGHKTPQLKPAWEPVLCFRAPDNGLKYADLALKHGSGCLNVDAGRIPVRENDRHEYGVSGDEGQSRFLANKYGRVAYEQHSAGRYPANLAMDEGAAMQLDEQSGITTSGAMKRDVGSYKGESVTKFLRGRSGPSNQHGDTGGASRFFYVAKANRTERNAGLEAVNDHPTVKPIELNRWLASLLLPPDTVRPRRLLVPFCGVGSEMIGALLAGWDEVVGVEQDAAYCKIAETRIQYWLGGG